MRMAEAGLRSRRAGDKEGCSRCGLMSAVHRSSTRPWHRFRQGIEGQLASAPWPQPPETLLNSLFDTLAALSAASPRCRLGVALPSVVQNGVVLTAANREHRTARHRMPAGNCATRLGRPVVVLNDADAAGLAEVHVWRGARRRAARSWC